MLQCVLQQCERNVQQVSTPFLTVSLSTSFKSTANMKLLLKRVHRKTFPQTRLSIAVSGCRYYGIYAAGEVRRPGRQWAFFNDIFKSSGSRSSV